MKNTWFENERPTDGGTVYVKPPEQPVCTICGEPYSDLVKHMREAH